MSPLHAAVNRVAARLEAEIPGLRTRVDYDMLADATVLKARYDCPCGEISGLCQVFYDGDEHVPVEWRVNRLKTILREHVREEGNEPNF
jgi:hypothetical protein